MTGSVMATGFLRRGGGRSGRIGALSVISFAATGGVDAPTGTPDAGSRSPVGVVPGGHAGAGAGVERRALGAAEEPGAPAGSGAASGTRSGFLMPTKAITPPIAASAAVMTIAVWKPADRSAGTSYVVPVMPAASGSAATAASWAARATVVLTPDATPA